MKKTVAVVTAFLVPVAVWVWWGLWGVRMVSAQWGAGQPTLGELGQTGDLFGGINALFAALAFTGVALAAIAQHHTLQITKQQLQAQSAQTSLLSFEPLFFRLLELQREMSKRMVLTASGLDHNGEGWEGSKRSLNMLLPVLARATVLNGWTPYLNRSEDERRALVVKPFLRLYERNEDSLGKV